MSLKSRLAATLIVAFVAILALGAVMTFIQANRNIAAELGAARSVAANRVAQLIARLPASNDTASDLSSFVRAFNGDRHVQVMLLDATGAIRFASQPAAPEWSLPTWFVNLFAPERATTIMPLSGSALPMTAVIVAIDPRNELVNTWTDLMVSLGVLVCFVLVAFAAVWMVADRALRPLASLQGAFGRIGGGDYGVAIEPAGPPEMRALAKGCNAMTARLAEISARNRRLSAQLLQFQDEERAELARDLHDEIGPQLFAIDVDASAISRLSAAARGPEGPGGSIGYPCDAVTVRAEAIKKAAQSARRDVRRILSDLRPGLMPGLGLKASIENLLAELSMRHPDVTFPADLADGDWGATLEILVHRAVREALNNALRHGHPTRIATRLAAKDTGLTFSVTDDGGGLPATGTSESATMRAAEGDPHGGFGLIGMRERIEAAGGTLSIGQVPMPAGVRITGTLPCPISTDGRVRRT